MAVQITCISKDSGNHENPYTAISNLGWKSDSDGSTGNSTRLEMYDFVKNKNGVAYVKRSIRWKQSVLDRRGNNSRN